VRIAIVGATGNVGTSLLRVLADESSVDSILGIARRIPRLEAAKTEWRAADIARDDLVPLFRGADAVVHLAWLIQPSRDLDQLWRTNVFGSDRVFRAVAEAGVGAFIYASSVGTYSRGAKDRRVDESWPTDGISTSFYARHKADVERRLDRFEHEYREVRVVRLRPGLIFKGEAATGIRRLFAGPLLPASLVRPGRLPFVPDIPGLRFQAVHSLDVADAYRRALVQDVRGAFNIAADPVLDPPTLARILGARLVSIGPRVARSLTSLTWRLHLQPTPASWLDLALGVPLMDTSKANRELGWEPTVGADDALRELLDGMSRGAGVETPPLSPKTSGPLRVREFVTGVGRSSGVYRDHVPDR
jgi:nucleoside-diphosphate-sugar epimerase